MLDSESLYVTIFYFTRPSFPAAVDLREVTSRRPMDVFPIDPLFHEGWYRVSSFCHDRALHTCVTFGGKVGRKKKGSAKRLNAPLSSLRERTRTIVSENARLPCTVGLEF